MILRRAGGRWRVLAHERGGEQLSHHVGHDARYGGGDGKDTEHSRHHVLPDTEFDELVVGRWLHVEQMDTGTWWMNVGGVTVWVTADRDGRPKDVQVYGPGDYDNRREGCAYGLMWSGAGHE